MANTNIFAMTDSWNNAGVIFTAIQMNVTDTASDPTSKLLDLQLGAASVFSVGKTILSFQNGANPLVFRVANAFTDINNFERAKFGWNANFLEIGTENLGTGSPRNIRFIFGTNVGGFNLGGSNVTPIMYVASGTTGKATGFLAGTGSSEIIYDSSGALSIGMDTRANIVNGTSTGGTAIWTFTPAGHLVAGADNTYDIGSAAARPRNLYMGSWLRMASATVATLPAAATAGANARMFVTDASAPAFGATVVGGGAVLTPVYSDGINWKVG